MYEQTDKLSYCRYSLVSNKNVARNEIKLITKPI